MVTGGYEGLQGITGGYNGLQGVTKQEFPGLLKFTFFSLFPYFKQ